MYECSVWIQFRERLLGYRKFNSWLNGCSKNLWASGLLQHATFLFKKASSTNAAEYAPIAKALYTLKADHDEVEEKFELAYFM